MASNIPINSAYLLIERFVPLLVNTYNHMYGVKYPGDRSVGAMGEVIETVVTAASELIAVGSDTLYHDLEHTVDVTITMQEILQGKATYTTVHPKDWCNSILAAVHHDLGYVPSLFEDDDKSLSGSMLAKVHVARSMRYVRERFSESTMVDGNILAEMIEYTNIPLINVDDVDSYGGLLRAADYIGQLSNINYRRRNQALFYEFQDTGAAAEMGYHSLSDVIVQVPDFFQGHVLPLIGPALNYLGRTISGQRKVNGLYGVIKQCEMAAGQIH